jgi:hypothetical protein
VVTGPIKCGYCGIESEGVIATDRDRLPVICGNCVDKGLRLEDLPNYREPDEPAKIKAPWED